MPLGSASDLDFMLKDAGVPVTFGLIEGYGILSIEDVQMISVDGGTITGRKQRLTVNATTFRTLVEGSNVDVNGTLYRVTQKWIKQDGVLAECWLADL